MKKCKLLLKLIWLIFQICPIQINDKVSYPFLLKQVSCFQKQQNTFVGIQLAEVAESVELIGITAEMSFC